VRAPGAGHSPADRSLIKLDRNAADGFVAHSFAHDDPIMGRDYVREKAGVSSGRADVEGHRRSSDVRAAQVAELARSRNEPTRWEIVAEYVSQLADDTPYLRVRRTADKQFWQGHWSGSGWEMQRPCASRWGLRAPLGIAAATKLVETLFGRKFVRHGRRLEAAANCNRLTTGTILAAGRPRGLSPPEHGDPRAASGRG
jgi:hypothetical protein